MKFKIVRNQKWMRHIKTRGMTLWPFILMRDDAVALFRHELQHVYQIKRMGKLKFYARWVWYSVNPKLANVLEIEADDIENTPLTPEEQAWWDRGVVTL